jgi:hypothetical protein
MESCVSRIWAAPDVDTEREPRPLVRGTIPAPSCDDMTDRFDREQVGGTAPHRHRKHPRQPGGFDRQPGHGGLRAHGAGVKDLIRKRKQIGELGSNRRRKFHQTGSAEGARRVVDPVEVDVERHRQFLQEVIERGRAADIGRTQQQRGLDLVGAAERLGERTHHHTRDAGYDAGSQYQPGTRRPRGGVDLFVRSTTPKFGQVRRDVGVSQPALDGGPQQRAAGLIDAADDDPDTIQRRRDRGRHGDVDAPSARAVSNRGRSLFRAGQVTAGDDNPIGVIRCEFGGDPPPDHAIAADDENVLIAQAETPARIRIATSKAIGGTHRRR